jgi:uncharacterized Zn finger protein (UPF0148 family)
MNDFDKEAEREKLREKFAKDEQKRARTSRMSELLLKGATMTNKHHDCGSPIFRWEGEEFCPTCQGAPGAEGVAEVPEDAGGAVDAHTADSTVEGATDVEVETPSEVPDPTEATDGTEPATTDPTPSPEPSSDPSPGPQSTPERASQPPTTTSATSTGEADTDLAAARASLTRTLTRLAKQAEAASDVPKQRDLLAAATEAAEALEAMKRADR